MTETEQPNAAAQTTDIGMQVWRATVVACSAILAVLIPLVLVFGTDGLPGFGWVYGVVTVVMIVDLVLNAAYMRRRSASFAQDAFANAREHSRSSRAAHWIIADVLAALPFMVLFANPALELLRLSKLIRVGQHMRSWRLRNLRYTIQLRFLFLIFWMALVAHWITCGWIALYGSASDPDGPLIAYINAFYWTITTLATVGFGDIIPRNPAERLYAVGTIVLGIGFFGYLLGLVASIWAKRDPARTHFEESIERLSMAVKYGHLPDALQHRIYDYHRYMWQQRLGYSEVEFLQELPRNLRAEVSIYLKRDLLAKCDFFVGADANFVREIAVHLRPIVLTPDDIVFRVGEAGDEMYFIANGAVDVIGPDGTQLARMGPGDFFGEIALLQEVPRTATVRALSYCDAYVLSRGAFQVVALRYPDERHKLEAEGRARQLRSTSRTE